MCVKECVNTRLSQRTTTHEATEKEKQKGGAGLNRLQNEKYACTARPAGRLRSCPLLP